MPTRLNSLDSDLHDAANAVDVNLPPCGPKNNTADAIIVAAISLNSLEFIPAIALPLNAAPIESAHAVYRPNVRPGTIHDTRLSVSG